MEEKYKHCDETLSKLLTWIGEVEGRLATQDVVQEDADELHNQINIMKVIFLKLLVSKKVTIWMKHTSKNSVMMMMVIIILLLLMIRGLFNK